MSTINRDATDFQSVDISSFPEESRYKFLTASVVPRPIALVTSLGKKGVLNAAPFSQFVIISVSPPLLGIVAHEIGGMFKDTVRNILESGEFVINSVTVAMAGQVQECAVAHPPEVSEVAVVGFHTLASVKVAPSRIAESPLHFECQLHKTVYFGDECSRTSLIVGEVVLVHGADGVIANHRVDHWSLNPLGRIAGRAYCLTKDVIQV